MQSERLTIPIGLLCVGLLTALPPAEIRGDTPIPDYFPMPKAIEKFEPEFPLAAWLAGKQGIVAFSVGVDSTGRVTYIRETQGDEVFSAPALQALKRWRYAPALDGSRPIASHDDAVFDFFVTEVVYSEDENRVLSCAAQPLVAYPFPCEEPDLVRTRYWNDLVAVKLDTLGFVENTRFLGEAPPDSQAVKRSARRWIFRPFISPEGPRAGKPTPVWAAIRIARSCTHGGRTLVSAADSSILDVLESPGSAIVGRLQPQPQDCRTIAGPILPDDFEWDNAWRIQSSVVEPGRLTSNSDSLRSRIKRIVQKAAPFAERDRNAKQNLPEPEYFVRLFKRDLSRGPSGHAVLDITISVHGNLMELVLDHRVLYVPLDLSLPEVAALLDDMFAK